MQGLQRQGALTVSVDLIAPLHRQPSHQSKELSYYQISSDAQQLVLLLPPGRRLRSRVTGEANTVARLSLPASS
jgi:hypothetical protein